MLAKAAKTLGFWVGRSRLFPAVPGTRDRKWTAGEALRSILRSLMPPMRNAGARAVNGTRSRRASGRPYAFVPRIELALRVLETAGCGVVTPGFNGARSLSG